MNMILVYGISLAIILWLVFCFLEAWKTQIYMRVGLFCMSKFFRHIIMFSSEDKTQTIGIILSIDSATTKDILEGKGDVYLSIEGEKL